MEIEIDLIQNGKRYKNLKWYQDLIQVSLETNTEFIDLANYFKKEEYKKLKDEGKIPTNYVYEWQNIKQKFKD